MPRHAIQVMAMIHTQPSSVTAHVLPARPLRPSRSKVYRPAIWARLAMTMMSAAMTTQPLIQPMCRPNARAVQVKLVPQSGSTLLSALWAYETNSIGMKANSMMIGARVPTSWLISPSVAARLYPGAVEATPMTTLESRPIAPSLRPLCAGDRPRVAGGAEVVIAAILGVDAENLQAAGMADVDVRPRRRPLSGARLDNEPETLGR